MKIEPGIGIGNIKFGITEDGLVDYLGEPNRIVESECIIVEGGVNREYYYYDIGLSFDFECDDNYRLSGIWVHSSGHKLYGQEVFGSSRECIESLMEKNTSEKGTFEDKYAIEPEGEFTLEYDDSGVQFFFENYQLKRGAFSYLFLEDGNTVSWPD